MATRKVTFTLDEETAARIDRLAGLLQVPKSQVVREAVQKYHPMAEPLSLEERTRMLEVLDEHLANLPPRPPGEMERELAELRRSRRHWGRLNGRGAD